ncbi:MAG TPA: alpha/beta hydrolase [Alphaproteobacteria bacterium]|nr:alpha/beta hydrolase [Alphaproteobacteria bacterium]
MRAVVFAPLLLAAVALLVPPSTAHADALACKPSGNAPSTTGVVLMHGALDGSGNWIASLKKKLVAAGFRLATPEMAWSERREYDRSYQQSLDQIATEVKGLEQHGARRVVVAGHSFGANAALGYAAMRGGVAGVAVIAPGQMPDLPALQQIVGASVAKARQMVAAGAGGKKDFFKDFLQWHGKLDGAYTTAANYLSYFDPTGDAVYPKNAAKLSPQIPLLWVDPAKNDNDTIVVSKAYAFDKAPRNPLSRYILSPSGHLDTPAASADLVVAWLKCL